MSSAELINGYRGEEGVRLILKKCVSLTLWAMTMIEGIIKRLKKKFLCEYVLRLKLRGLLIRKTKLESISQKWPTYITPTKKTWEPKRLYVSMFSTITWLTVPFNSIRVTVYSFNWLILLAYVQRASYYNSFLFFFFRQLRINSRCLIFPWRSNQHAQLFIILSDWLITEYLRNPGGGKPWPHSYHLTVSSGKGFLHVTQSKAKETEMSVNVMHRFTLSLKISIDIGLGPKLMGAGV